MFLSHNPVTPLKTPPDSPLQPEPPQLLLCFALITQQQQSTEATPGTVCPRCQAAHFDAGPESASHGTSAHGPSSRSVYGRKKILKTFRSEPWLHLREPTSVSKVWLTSQLCHLDGFYVAYNFLTGHFLWFFFTSLVESKLVFIFFKYIYTAQLVKCLTEHFFIFH